MAVIVNGAAAFRGIIVDLFLALFSAFEDWRFVDEAVTEQLELGLITDSVDESDDLGFIV